MRAGNVYEKNDQELVISRSTGTAYRNNPSEEAIFETNKIKKEHETMKLHNEEDMLKNF